MSREQIIETIKSNGCYLVPSGFGNFGTDLETAFNDLLRDGKIRADGTQNGFHRFILSDPHERRSAALKELQRLSQEYENAP